MFLEVNRGRKKKQEKEPALLLRRFAHNFRSAGSCRILKSVVPHMK